MKSEMSGLELSTCTHADVTTWFLRKHGDTPDSRRVDAKWRRIGAEERR